MYLEKMNKKLQSFFNIAFIIIIVKTITGCANISAPTGGPKDEIPPKAIGYSPINNITNFKSKTITIKFSEKIQDIEDVNLILINPILTKELKVKVNNKKNLEITFNEELQDSTTYTINFRSAIKDLAEGNTTSEDILYNFSTGKYIDSNRLYGSTIDLLKNTVKEKVIVAIYRISDTLNIEKHKPLYLTQINKDGSYEIRNIKSGIYRVFSFADNNNKMLYDSDEKIIDFKDTVNIIGSKKIDFKLSKIKKKGIKIISEKAVNNNEYIINLNTGIINATLINNDKHKWRKKISSNGKALSIYNINNAINDSIPIAISFTDSLGRDTILNTKIIYNDNIEKEDKKITKKKKEVLKILKPLENKLKNLEQEILISFNHPIKRFTEDSLTIKFDSIGIVKKEKIKYTWDVDSVLLTIKTNINFTDSINIQTYKNTFVNIMGDSIDKFKQKYTLYKDVDNGLISGTIETKKKNILLQILDENYKVLKTINVDTKFIFDNLKTGKYYLRSIVDGNNNGKWDEGNIKELQRAEEMYYYETLINLKTDWEINDIVIKIDDK